MSESPEQGKRRLADRDREADQGERVDEYRRGDWVEQGDPANHARAKAADENATRSGDSPPGMSPNNEAWQREKQNLGQTADEPGLPHTWREQGEQPRRKHGRTDAKRMGHRLTADELPDSTDQTPGGRACKLQQPSLSQRHLGCAPSVAAEDNDEVGEQAASRPGEWVTEPA